MPSPNRENTPRREETQFGDRRVRLEAKQGLVDDVFHKVADRYDLMNDLMSGGLHRLWKDMLVAKVAPPRHRAYRSSRRRRRHRRRRVPHRPRRRRATRVTVADVNADMLRVGERRARRRREFDRLEFVEANAEAVAVRRAHPSTATRSPSASATCRASTRRSAEAYRVLRRGGRFLCLEFSRVDAPGLGRLYEAYSNTAIPALGRVVTGDGAPYRYLVESIRQFPTPERFADMIGAAGFARVGSRADCRRDRRDPLRLETLRFAGAWPR